MRNMIRITNTTLEVLEDKLSKVEAMESTLLNIQESLEAIRADIEEIKQIAKPISFKPCVTTTTSVPETFGSKRKCTK